jgi:hypothetical protein
LRAGHDYYYTHDHTAPLNNATMTTPLAQGEEQLEKKKLLGYGENGVHVKLTPEKG